MLAHGLPGGSTAGKYAFGRRVLTRLTMCYGSPSL